MAVETTEITMVSPQQLRQRQLPPPRRDPQDPQHLLQQQQHPITVRSIKMITLHHTKFKNTSQKKKHLDVSVTNLLV